MKYIGRIFRPPSEAHSLIIQGTVGCSHNECAFCGMYRDKVFRARPASEILADIREAGLRRTPYEKLFIADGDALALGMDTWRKILPAISAQLPSCRSVTAYATPAGISRKTDSELLELAGMGLKMLYVGLESGSDDVLALMRKGVTSAQIIEAGLRVRKAGIMLSVTAISGLGGKARRHEHAVETGRALSEMRPDYIGLLSLLPEGGAPILDWIADGSFEPLTPFELLHETKLLLEHTCAEGAVFRTNHPSNHLSLKGMLNADKRAMLARLERAVNGGLELNGEQLRAL